MWKCQKCNEECEDNFDACWSCGTGRDGSLPANPSPEEEDMESDDSPVPLSPPSPSKSGGRSVMRRYTDAYLTARAITAVGGTVKFLAFLLAGGIVLISLIAGSKSMWFLAGGILLGAVLAIPIYILGILVSAQGQILKATLDTAVNSSQLLSKDEMRKIMSLD